MIRPTCGGITRRIAGIALLLASIISASAAHAQSDGVGIAASPADIARYEAAPAAAAVTVNGRPDHVYAFLHEGIMDGDQPTLPSNFVQFDLDPGHSAHVLATYGMPVTSATVRPLSAGIHPRVDGTRVAFDVPHPGHYVLEVNDAIANPTNRNAPLLVFADVPEAEAPPSAMTTVFPAGKVTTLPGFRLNTRANHTYVIPAGAVVRGVIVTDGQANVAVRGHGVILYDHDVFQNYKSAHLAQLTPLFVYGSPGFRASGVTVVTATNQYTPSPNGDLSPWAVLLTKSPHARLEHLKVINQFLDGVEFNGEEDAALTGSFVQAGDDTLGIKAACYGYKGGGAGINPKQNIFADNETITTGPGSPMKITELNQPSPSGKPCGPTTGRTTEASDITYRHIDVMHASLRTKIGINGSSPILAILNAYQVHVHNITYQDIVAEDVVRKNFLVGFDLTPQSALYGANPGGSISDVHIDRFAVRYRQDLQHGKLLALDMPGYGADSIVSNIYFADLSINGIHIIQDNQKKNAAGIEFANKIELLNEKFPPKNVRFR